jgi:hypothetical protein
MRELDSGWHESFSTRTLFDRSRAVARDGRGFRDALRQAALGAQGRILITEQL